MCIRDRIVDDHAGFRRILRDFLPSGRITECSDGLEALEVYGALKPDWVLMDIEMSGMDGLTATRYLLERHPEARIILISNYPAEGFSEIAKKLGSRGFVHKSHLEEIRLLMASFDLTDHSTSPPTTHP